MQAKLLKFVKIFPGDGIWLYFYSLEAVFLQISFAPVTAFNHLEKISPEVSPGNPFTFGIDWHIMSFGESLWNGLLCPNLDLFWTKIGGGGQDRFFGKEVVLKQHSFSW